LPWYSAISAYTADVIFFFCNCSSPAFIGKLEPRKRTGLSYQHMSHGYRAKEKSFNEGEKPNAGVQETA
jgi:hypothetical protein